MSKIRVLVFTNSFRIGGSERQAVELIKRVDPARFEIIVACFQKDGPLLKELPLAISQLHEFPLVGFFHPSTAGHAFRFIRLLKRATSKSSNALISTPISLRSRWRVSVVCR